MEKWEKELEQVFSKRLGLSFRENEGLKNEYIFGKKIGLPVREAILLYFDIERIIGCQLPEDKLINGEFETYSKIKQLVRDLMQEKIKS